MSGMRVCLLRRCGVAICILSSLPLRAHSEDELGMPTVEADGPDTQKQNALQTSLDLEPSGIINQESHSAEVRDDSKGIPHTAESGEVKDANDEPAVIATLLVPNEPVDSVDDPQQRGMAPVDVYEANAPDLTELGAISDTEASRESATAQEAGVVHGMKPDARDETGAIRLESPRSIAEDLTPKKPESATVNLELSNALQGDDSATSAISSSADNEKMQPTTGDAAGSIHAEAQDGHSDEMTLEVVGQGNVKLESNVAASHDDDLEKGTRQVAQQIRNLRHRISDDDMALASNSALANTEPTSLVTEAPAAQHMSTTRVWPLSLLNILLIIGMRIMCWRRSVKKRSPEEVLAEVYAAAAKERNASTNKMVADML